MSDPVATDAITIATCHNGAEHSISYADSVEAMRLWDLSHEARIFRGGYIKMRTATNGLVQARNMAVQTFLDNERADWLLWIDDDMGFEPNAAELLYAVADAEKRPVVGGLCFAQKETDPDGFNGFRTSARVCIFDWVKLDDDMPTQFTARSWYPPNSVVKCAGVGCAFVLIHRSAFVAIAEQYGPTWYDRVRGDDGEKIGEDISFCIRANALGIPIHVHTGVRTTHMKRLWLAEQDFWNQHVPPPAIEPVAVCVPVMRRPQNAEPFMRSLRASTGLATAYAICDEDDVVTRDAWKNAGAHVIQSSGTRFATKINDAYRATNEPWMFIVGDDVSFHPGWYDHAICAAESSGCRVIGTNDLGSQRVIRGEHATHILIDRNYITNHGASWDGPGVVCHEGYTHWYVDDEIVTLARARGTFVAALGSKVEHLHPLFNKGLNDEVYVAGQAHRLDDQALFDKRLKAQLTS